jgi:hypothetical protein
MCSNYHSDKQQEFHSFRDEVPIKKHISFFSNRFLGANSRDDDNTKKRVSFTGGTLLSLKAIWNISRTKKNFKF